MPQNNQQDPWSKIFMLERDLLENQKYLNKLDDKYSDLLNKLDALKDDIRSQKNVADFEERICDLEEMVDSLRQEMPEMRLIKKLFFALVGFVLMSFLGLIWNSVVLNSSKNQSMISAESSKEFVHKVIEEYNKR